MRCEFAKDDNGTIWFLYVNKIIIRDMSGQKQENPKVKHIKFINKDH